MNERVDIVKRFWELFPEKFSFSPGPFRSIPYNQQGIEGIKQFGGNLIAWDGSIDTVIVKEHPSYLTRVKAKQLVTQFGLANDWTSCDETDAELTKLHDGFQQAIDNVLPKLLITAARNRTDMSMGHPIHYITRKEMVKRYKITHLCVPKNFEDKSIDIPIYKFDNLSRCIGLSIMDENKSPFIIYYKSFNIFRDENLISDILGVYAWVECSFVVYDTNCVFLSNC